MVIKKTFRLMMSFFLLLSIFAGSNFITPLNVEAASALNVWSPPAGTTQNNTFTVQVRKSGDTLWTDLFEYNVKVGHQDGTSNDSSMVNFDFSGTVDVKVTYNSGTINSYEVRPLSYGINPSQSGNTLTFSMTQDDNSPRKSVLRINDDWETKVLHIVTNSPETGAPLETDSNVYVINPGDTIPLELPAGKDTYYFKPGLHDLPKGLWLDIDLGATYSIDTISLDQGEYSMWGSINSGQIKFTVQTKVNSDDSYTTAYDGTGNTSTGDITRTFTARNARYVRLNLLGNNATGSWVFASVVKEFRVFAAGGSTNLALNHAISGGMPCYANAVDGSSNTEYRSSSQEGYGNWHAGESFYLGKSGTTVYIAGGATVRGSFMSDGVNNITVKGRGVLDCSQLRHTLTSPNYEGRTGAVWLISGSDNRVEGINVLNPAMWSVVMSFSTRPIVKNISIFGSGVNADGIHLTGCNNGTVDGVFIRTCDDNFVMYHYAPGSYNTFKNSVLWGDDARIALLGLAGSDGNQPIDNITFQNLDILNQRGVWDLELHNGCFTVWANGENTISNITFDNIRIDPFREPSKASIFHFKTQGFASGVQNGKIRNITMSDITYRGSGEMPSKLSGVDATHDVQGVNFTNYLRNGHYVTNESSGNINKMSYVSNVSYSYPPTANLALNKTYSTNGTIYQSNGVANMFDGSIDSACVVAETSNVWFEVNFGTSTTFDSCKLSEYDNKVTGYRIEYYNGSSWQTAYTGTTIGTYGYLKDVSFAPVTGTKARLYLTGSNGNGYPVFYEMQVYSSGATPPPVNLALNKTYSTNGTTYQSNGVGNMFDGDIGTACVVTETSNVWFEVNFGTSTTFNSCKLSEYDNKVTGYRIEYYNGSSWQTAYTGTTIGTYGYLKDVSFAPVTGTKARLYLTGSNGNGYPVFYEMQVYNNS